MTARPKFSPMAEDNDEVQALKIAAAQQTALVAARQAVENINAASNDSGRIDVGKISGDHIPVNRPPKFSPTTNPKTGNTYVVVSN